MTSIEKTLKVLSILADAMTVLGVGGVLTYGVFTKDKNLLGRKVYRFIVVAFRLWIVLAAGILIYALYEIPYGLTLVILKGKTGNFYWEEGKEIQHILAYLVTTLLLIVPYGLLSMSVFTASLYYPKLFLKNILGGYFHPDLSMYKRHVSLEIVEAVYGSPSHNIDVTAILRSMVDAGKLRVFVTNSLAGDPHYGVVKTLRIRYRLGDETEKTMVKTEGELLEIPESEETV
jgi:hypothetical protein